MKLEALAKESDDPALATLRDRLQSITDKLEGRGEKLDSMVGRIADLTENVKALELWIVTVVQNLQSKYILWVMLWMHFQSKTIVAGLW